SRPPCASLATVSSTALTTSPSTRFTAAATVASSSFMSATISAVDCELRSFERGFSCSVIGSALSVVIFRSDCESNMIDAFTCHSSGSFGGSEVGWLEIRARRNLSDLRAQRVKHQVAGGTKDTADVRDLKTVALHLQMANHGDCRQSELRATIGNNLQRHRIVCLCCINHVPAKTCQPFVRNRWCIDRSRQIVRAG